MSLKEKLMEDLKDSMKSKDTIKKNTITMVRAAIKQKEVDERIEVSEEAILDIISKQLKEKRMAIEEFKKGQRQDLVELTEKEIEILLQYLPKQLSEEEVEEIVIETIKEINATSMKDIGIIMKAVMPKVKGRTDGNIVNKIIKKVFN
ncbi:GatB/YqeY domain-containing protein [Tissierella carlieri]|uniref:GatB/YqeY domain-containing protein n=1 Tax=Tissierella carlieri TaxID=689904 RepID=A0ABT1SBA1_9FIRM|nr:GatB/YqeY domain-containing protein [Tissierella carlieri]MBU5313604.1 GatB/YqeY domain-containing protein [Tissierella carlieri]MCQ4923769.1 GatB/YqeY domain-containing protein [Tissierella carlieri]